MTARQAKSSSLELRRCAFDVSGGAAPGVFIVATRHCDDKRAVQRTFADFEWLESTARVVLAPGCILPTIPSASVLSTWPEENGRAARRVMYLRRFVRAVGSHPELCAHRLVVAWFLGSAEALAEVKAVTLTAISKDLERDRMFLVLGSTVKGLMSVSVSSSGAHAGTMALALEDVEAKVATKMKRPLPTNLSLSKACRVALVSGVGRAWAAHLSHRRAWSESLIGHVIAGREAATLAQATEAAAGAHRLDLQPFDELHGSASLETVLAARCDDLAGALASVAAFTAASDRRSKLSLKHKAACQALERAKTHGGEKRKDVAAEDAAERLEDALRQAGEHMLLTGLRLSRDWDQAEEAWVSHAKGALLAFAVAQRDACRRSAKSLEQVMAAEFDHLTVAFRRLPPRGEGKATTHATVSAHAAASDAGAFRSKASEVPRGPMPLQQKAPQKTAPSSLDEAHGAHGEKETQAKALGRRDDDARAARAPASENGGGGRGALAEAQATAQRRAFACEADATALEEAKREAAKKDEAQSTALRRAANGRPAESPNAAKTHPPEALPLAAPTTISFTIALGESLGLGLTHDLTVQRATPEGQGARAAVQAGWRVVRVGGWTVATLPELKHAMAKLKTQSPSSDATCQIVFISASEACDAAVTGFARGRGDEATQAEAQAVAAAAAEVAAEAAQQPLPQGLEQRRTSQPPPPPPQQQQQLQSQEGKQTRPPPPPPQQQKFRQPTEMQPQQPRPAQKCDPLPKDGSAAGARAAGSHVEIRGQADREQAGTQAGAQGELRVSTTLNDARRFLAGL